MADKMNVLFVDDEQKVLDGLRRMLRVKRTEWNMQFASSGQEALALFEEHAFDVIVSDMRMPGMSGEQLLCEVRTRYPKAVRLVLSGQADKDDILKSVGPIHQFMQKPCDAQTLISTISRTCALSHLFDNDDLKAMVTELESLPSLPEHQEELMNKLQTPGVSPHLIGEAISRDVAMTAKILQLVNSSFFALQRKVECPADAVSLLGLETVRSLVLTMQVFSQVSRTEVKGFSQESLLAHSSKVANAAKTIAAKAGMDASSASEVYMAGLLHDVGKLVFASQRPEPFAEAMKLARTESIAPEEAERQLIGASHGEIGAFLLGLWAFNNPIVEAAAFHHCPSRSDTTEFSALTAVHIANALVRHSDQEDDATELDVDMDYLQRLGLADKLSVWRDSHRQAA